MVLHGATYDVAPPSLIRSWCHGRVRASGPRVRTNENHFAPPPSELDWITTPEGVAFAALEGDRFTRAYQSMMRLPAGIASPMHVKSANMFGIVIQGDMIHYAKGKDPSTAHKIGAGAF
ncbi:MAG: hypothetical protein COC12_12845 [Rhodobacteraceae bacterium]|nr:MAG: hypothetical protein COC12_12845 [Paracoccaceae bacterium]